MISDSYLDRFDAVIVWKSDRFSRNGRQAMAYRDILKENKVKLLSATEPNIEGPAGILFEAMNDGYNEYYVAEMKVKMRRGEKENVLEGKINGGTVPYGFKHTGKYTWEVDEEEVKKIRYVFDTYASEDMTINALVKLLKKKGLFDRKGEPFKHATLYRMLSNRKYIGEYHWGEVSNNCLPVIVD
jgi:site-specific DNA recombinase